MIPALNAYTLPTLVEPERLAGELRKGVAGRRLAEIGMDDDVLTAAHIDRFASVPELDPGTFRTRLP